MYWTNFWLPTMYLQQNIFEKTFIEVHILTLLLDLLRPNWSIIQDTVSKLSLEIHKSLLPSYRRKMSSTDYFSVMFVNSGPKFPIWTYKTITKSNNIFILHKNIFRKNMVFVQLLWALYYFSNVLLAGLTAAFPNTSTTNCNAMSKI